MSKLHRNEEHEKLVPENETQREMIVFSQQPNKAFKKLVTFQLRNL